MAKNTPSLNPLSTKSKAGQVRQTFALEKAQKRSWRKGGRKKQGNTVKVHQEFSFFAVDFWVRVFPRTFPTRALRARITLSTLGKIQFHLPICRRWHCPRGRGTYHIRANFWHCKVQHFSRWSLLKMHSKMKRKTGWKKETVEMGTDKEKNGVLW